MSSAEALEKRADDTYQPIVTDVLNLKETKIVSVKASIPAIEAAKIMAGKSIGLLIVVNDEGQFYGVLSERDIVRAFARLGPDSANLLVKDLATTTVRACSSTRTLQSVLDSMKAGRFRHMPVVENGQVKGVISTTDILRYFIS